MIGAAVTPEFGVLAADSASTEATGEISYETPKTFYLQQRNLITGMGLKLYFSRLRIHEIPADLVAAALYMEEYFQSLKPSVESAIKQLKINVNEFPAAACVLILGVYNGKPTVVQVNSYQNFKPKYLYAKDKHRFAAIAYGGPENQKKKMFSQIPEYMENRAVEYQKAKIPLTPGIFGEILTRGIYEKSDIERKLGSKKKYSGGAVTVGGVYKDGKAFTLSNVKF